MCETAIPDGNWDTLPVFLRRLIMRSWYTRYMKIREENYLYPTNTENGILTHFAVLAVIRREIYKTSTTIHSDFPVHHCLKGFCYKKNKNIQSPTDRPVLIFALPLEAFNIRRYH